MEMIYMHRKGGTRWITGCHIIGLRPWWDFTHWSLVWLWLELKKKSSDWEQTQKTDSPLMFWGFPSDLLHTVSLFEMFVWKSARRSLSWLYVGHCVQHRDTIRVYFHRTAPLGFHVLQIDSLQTKMIACLWLLLSCKPAKLWAGWSGQKITLGTICDSGQFVFCVIDWSFSGHHLQER